MVNRAFSKTATLRPLVKMCPFRSKRDVFQCIPMHPAWHGKIKGNECYEYVNYIEAKVLSNNGNNVAIIPGGNP